MKLLLKPPAGVTVVVEKREDPSVLGACACSEAACSLLIYSLTQRTINLSDGTVCSVLAVLLAYGCLFEGAPAATSDSAT